MTIVWTMTPERLESQEGPCGCCWQHEALEDGVWTCQKSHHRWVVQQEVQQAADHASHECQGNCSVHPLMAGYLQEYEPCFWSGRKTWGDLWQEEEASSLAAETPEQQMRRLNREAAAAAASALDSEAIKRQVYARDVEFRTKLGLRKGQQVQKRLQPCKWCIGEFKGDECWAHEYTDPKTGRRETPRTCDRIHPGEAGWCNEWFTNPRFNPAASPTENRFGALKGRAAAPVQPQASCSLAPPKARAAASACQAAAPPVPPPRRR